MGNQPWMNKPLNSQLGVAGVPIKYHIISIYIIKHYKYET